MPGNQLQGNLGEIQSLINATHSIQQDQHSTSTAFSQRTSDTVQSGLAGTVRNAASSVGQERDVHWRQTYDGNQRLVDNGSRALRVNSDGQDSAHNAMIRTGYGTGSVINP